MSQDPAVPSPEPRIADRLHRRSPRTHSRIRRHGSPAVWFAGFCLPPRPRRSAARSTMAARPFFRYVSMPGISTRSTYHRRGVNQPTSRKAPTCITRRMILNGRVRYTLLRGNGFSTACSNGRSNGGMRASEQDIGFGTTDSRYRSGKDVNCRLITTFRPNFSSYRPLPPTAVRGKPPRTLETSRFSTPEALARFVQKTERIVYEHVIGTDFRTIYTWCFGSNSFASPAVAAFRIKSFGRLVSSFGACLIRKRRK